MCCRYSKWMVNITDILADPRLHNVDILAGNPSRSIATEVALVEDLSLSIEFQSNSLVILGRVASEVATGYMLDIVVRRAAAQNVAGLMLTGHAAPPRISATATALADRSGIVLLCAPKDASLTELVIAISASVFGSAEEALRRADDALTNLTAAESTSEPGDITSLLSAASESLGVEVSLRDPQPGELATRVRLESHDFATVAAEDVGGFQGVASRLVVALTTAALERSVSSATWGIGSPVRSRNAVLSDILIASDSHWERLSDQARDLGIPIDGWHRALMLGISDTPDSMSYDFLQTVGEVALRAVRGPGATWHSARSEDKVVLVEMWHHDPGSSAVEVGLRNGRSVLDAVGMQFPWLKIRCSVGRPHQGLLGLRVTVAEARSALTSKSQESLVGYDLTGLQPMLLEWSGSDTARQAMHELLRPLENLEEERARTAITTLQVYLDEQGSLMRAAARLFVHRNAVAYRMRKITELLNIDLQDADQRLAVQLACHAWLLR
jgi:hypothetical protein